MELSLVVRVAGAAAFAGLWLLLAACGGEVAANTAMPEVERPAQRVNMAAETERTPAVPKKRDPAETIEWRDGRFATVWDPGS